MTRPYIFTSNPLERAEIERRNQNWIADRDQNPTSRFLPLQYLNVLIEEGEATKLAWISRAELEESGINGPLFLLGLKRDIAHFVVDTSNYDLLHVGGTRRFEDARSAAATLSIQDAGILAQARANVDWHSRHQFCSVCGHPTELRRGGQQRSCTSCRADHFPRTDPVVIVVATDGERCLLGQSRGRLARNSMYSALAGFVDQGESIEEAVRREVVEEAGIEIGEVRYHSSQPWPFPSSLMIGCHADALTTTIRADDVEMRDVRWFHRSIVKRALVDADSELKVPGEIAIAHHLISAWANNKATRTVETDTRKAASEFE